MPEEVRGLGVIRDRIAQGACAQSKQGPEERIPILDWIRELRVETSEERDALHQMRWEYG